MSSRRTTLTLLAAVSWAIAASPHSGQLQIRLTSPLASYSRPGTTFEALVIGPRLPGEDTLPAGSVIRGAVRKAQSVGLGFRRERAVLELAFESCESPDGSPLACEVELIDVDNARETVQPGNQIKGILAASHAHSWLNGIWYRPDRVFAARSAAGLTGTAGILQSRLAPSPIGAGVFFASRMILMTMPEPEIQLPAGTDLIVNVKSPEKPATESATSIVQRFDAELADLPAEVTRPDGTPVQDLIHFAFAASEQDIVAAFEAAGWQPADPRTAGSVARTYRAYVSMKNYATAPVSPLLYEGTPPDLVFQRSFNSVSERHHIRLWKLDRVDGTPMFLAAATHDVGIAVRWNRMEMTHEIDPAIDRERTKVLNDLSYAGCIAGVEAVDRPSLAVNRPGKDGLETDGLLYRVELKNCTRTAPTDTTAFTPHRRAPARFVRRLVLETRHYFTRGSVFYWGVRGVRSGFRKFVPVSE